MTQKQSAISLSILILVVLCGALWYRILHRDKFNTPSNSINQGIAVGEPNPSAPSDTGYEAPILLPDPPKLAGSVIVGPKVSTRFYLAKNGKRYVFPDGTKTFDTWFPSGTKIVNVTEAELESYPLGGNVCYKPGTRLIKIMSDYRVFAVAHGCTLRPINDGTAVQIFGKSWKSLVDELPEFYFTNYTVGPQVSSNRDYSIAAEQGKSQTIDMDKGF